MPDTIHGRIVTYCADVSAGLIRASDGRQFVFAKKEWRPATPPSANMSITFESQITGGALNVCAA